MEKLPIGFRVDLLFPDEYTDFVAEVYFDGKFICTILQEQGIDSLDLEFAEYSIPEKVVFPLRDFQNAVEYARQRFHDLRKGK